MVIPAPSEPAFAESDGVLGELARQETAKPPVAESGGGESQRASPQPAAKSDTRPQQSETPADPSWGKWALPGIIAVFAVAMIFGNNVTRLFFVLLTAAAVQGYWLRASKLLPSVAGLVVAIPAAIPLGIAGEGLTRGLLGTTGLLNRMISVGLFAVVILVVVTAALHVLVRRVLSNRPRWRRYDRLGGLALGAVQGMLVGMVAVWAMLTVGPVAEAAGGQDVGDGVETEQTSASVRVGSEMGRQARESIVGRIFEGINPFREMLYLPVAQRALVVVNDPEARETFVEHEAIRRLRERESFSRTVEMLLDDDEIVAVIDEAGEQGRLSWQGLLSLLSSDALLSALDETGVVHDVSHMAEDIREAVDDAYEQARQRTDR